MSIKDLVGKQVSREVNFMNSKVKIHKLTLGQVEEIQEAAKALEENAEGDSLAALKKIIQAGVEGGTELSDDDLKSLPIGELTALATEVMSFSGLTEKGK